MTWNLERKGMTTHRQVTIAGLVPAADGRFSLTLNVGIGADKTVHALLQLTADRVGAHAGETSVTVLEQKVQNILKVVRRVDGIENEPTVRVLIT